MNPITETDGNGDSPIDFIGWQIGAVVVTPLEENVNSPMDCSSRYELPIAVVEDSLLPPADTTITLLRTTPLWNILPKGGRR